MNPILKQYSTEVSALYKTGADTEHSFRPALQTLLDSLLPQYKAVNEPRRCVCGAPDYVLLGKTDNLPHAYLEAKKLFDRDLRGEIPEPSGHKEQFDRYKKSLSRIVFTDYLTFLFYVNGNLTAEVRLLEQNNKGGFKVINEDLFIDTLKGWSDAEIQQITQAPQLVQVMANKAKMIQTAILASLQSEDLDMLNLYGQFQTSLINDLTHENFADYIAQTITYGMFAARLYDETPNDFSRQEAANIIPDSNPFLKRLFQQIAGYNVNDNIVWILDDLAAAFAQADVANIISTYQQHKDPLIHFYEDFLQIYNPNYKKEFGVFYTPLPVVEFIVRAVDDILMHDFNLPMGLADRSTIRHKVMDEQTGKMIEQEFSRVQILDPATGTGTFLAQTLRQIHSHFAHNQGLWQSYVDGGLLKRLHGFELLVAPYTIAHLKMSLTLQETGATANNRFSIYLTNALQQAQHHDLFSFVSNEGILAGKVKNNTPMMVVLGNPPYAVSSNNKGEWISRLVDDYKKDLNEKNIQPLSDDYIKFIRLAHYHIERSGQGIVAFISNNSFLDGLIHRQMRKSLLETFDEIYIINLHGNSKRKETAPDGSKDQNIFDIMVGVSINIFVKQGGATSLSRKKCKDSSNEARQGCRTSLAQIHYLDLYGTRDSKLSALNELSLPNKQGGATSLSRPTAEREPSVSGACSDSAATVLRHSCDTNWQTLTPTAPNYFFVPKDFTLQEEYKKGIPLNELFKVFSNGVESGRDELFVSFDESTLQQKIGETFEDRTLLASKYNIKETPSCRIISNHTKSSCSPENVVSISYRPLDTRYIYYDNALLRRGFEKVMQHMILGENIGIMCCRQSNTDWRHAFVADNIAERCFVSAQSKECGYLFPLYLYSPDGTRHLNLREELLQGGATSLSRPQSKQFDEARQGCRTSLKAEDFFAYIYAVLHSPTYRERYKEFLKIDFPRIPIPTDEKTEGYHISLTEYHRLVALGKELIDLHLMRQGSEVSNFAYPLPNYPIAGNNIVEFVKFVPNGTSEVGNFTSLTGKLYINKTQYFDNVPEAAYNMFIGGYQPAQKWLKDRKGKALSFDDIFHYLQILSTLNRTLEIMAEIG